MDEIRRGSRGPAHVGNTAYGAPIGSQAHSLGHSAAAPAGHQGGFNESPNVVQANQPYSGATNGPTSGYASSSPYPVSGQPIRVNEPYIHVTTPTNTPIASAPIHTPQTAPTYHSNPGSGVGHTGNTHLDNDYDSPYAVGGAVIHHHGRHDKVSNATKGQLFDETGGVVDDRTRMQKLADKFSTGSAVGKHTSDVPGWAPNAGPNHGYPDSTGPTRFTHGNVATDADPVGNSRNDITGPYSGSGYSNQGSGYGNQGAHLNQGGLRLGHTGGPYTDTGYGGSHGGLSSGVGPHSGTGYGQQGSTGELHSGGPSQLGAGGEGPQYVTNEFGDVLGTQPQKSGHPQGGGRGVPHSHINPSHTGTTTRGGLVGGSGDYETIGHEGIKVSKATRGHQYDATGGAIDDRTTGQKIKDAFIPGNSVGNHTKHQRY